MIEVFVWPDNSFVLVDDYEDVQEQWRGNDFRREVIPSNVPFEDIPQYLENKPQDVANTASKWFWMMDYCKQRGLAPANHKVWEEAELAYRHYYKK